jgi:hypothetical protein
MSIFNLLCLYAFMPCYVYAFVSLSFIVYCSRRCRFTLDVIVYYIFFLRDRLLMRHDYMQSLRYTWGDRNLARACVIGRRDA